MWLNDHASQREMFSSVYRGESTYIPLGISLKSTFSVNRWEYYDDWPRMLENELAKAEGIRAIGSDQIPTIVLRFDPVVLLSMFGAEVINVGGRPFSEPVFRHIEGTLGLTVPSLDAGILPRITEAIAWFRRNSPENMILVTPPETDPFDVLLLLFGSDVLLWMAEDPVPVKRALSVITETFIAVQHHGKQLLGEPQREKVTYLGNWIPGVRVAADAVVNLSPDMIREFCWPVFDRIAEEFGQVLVHYCPSPGQKYYHVVKPILDCPSVMGIDTSGGSDYFESPDNPQRLTMAGTLFADCGFNSPPHYPTMTSSSTNINRWQTLDWDKIDAWLDTDFMRLSQSKGRGLVLRTSVNTVEEGQELYGLWQERLRIKGYT